MESTFWVAAIASNNLPEKTHEHIKLDGEAIQKLLYERGRVARVVLRSGSVRK